MHKTLPIRNKFDISSPSYQHAKYAQQLGKENALVVYAHAFSTRLLQDPGFNECRQSMIALYNHTNLPANSIFLVGSESWMGAINGILHPQLQPHIYFVTYDGSLPFAGGPDGKGGMLITKHQPIPDSAIRSFLERLDSCIQAGGEIVLVGVLQTARKAQESIRGFLAGIGIELEVSLAPKDFLYDSHAKQIIRK